MLGMGNNSVMAVFLAVVMNLLRLNLDPEQKILHLSFYFSFPINQWKKDVFLELTSRTLRINCSIRLAHCSHFLSYCQLNFLLYECFFFCYLSLFVILMPLAG